MFHSLFDGFAYWIVRGAASFLQSLPLERALRIGRTLGGVVYFFNSRRHVAYTNLKAAFPESTAHQRKRWTREMFRLLGMTAVEILRIPVLTQEDVERTITQSPSYWDYYLKACEARKGLILLTAHFGNWELSQITEGIFGRPLTVLARRQKYRRLDGFLNHLREFHGSVSVGKGGEIRDLIRALRRGEVVGILGDQSGRDDGVWIRFFGRLTPSPRGPMALALRLGVNLLPVFMVRREGPYHELIFESDFQLVRTGDDESDIRVNTQNYIHLLESYLRKYPSQWLWGHKRWKRTRTKRITILSDGKPGHVKQSEALVAELVAEGNRKTPPYEMPLEKIEVKFRSPWRRRLFPVFAFFFGPWAQGRLGWLRFFLTSETLDEVMRTNPDMVISTGASLAGLNRSLVTENLAKSIILMKPSLPFNLLRYDLVLVPAHDRGVIPRGSLRIHGAWSRRDEKTLERSKEVLSRSLREPSRVRFGLFLGGETRKFKLSLAQVEVLLGELERLGERGGGDYLVTTSRRTPEEINQFFRTRAPTYPHCQLCVVAADDPRLEVVPGMMALADYLLVTEDSLSMISEALSSGKHVIVVKMSSKGLPEKHYRFQEFLRKEWQVPVVEARRLSEIFGNDDLRPPHECFEQERAEIRERLGALL